MTSPAYKKLKLVDEQEIHRLIEKQIRQYDPAIKAMADLTLDMGQTLNRKDLTPEEKLGLLQANQQRFAHLRPYAMPSSAAAPPPLLPTGLPVLPPNTPNAAAAAAADSTPNLLKSAADKLVSEGDGKTMSTSYSDGSTEAERSTRIMKHMPRVPPKHDYRMEHFSKLIDSSQGVIDVDPKSGELIIEGQKIPDSSFRELMREFYTATASPNLKGQDLLLSTIAKLRSPGEIWENIKLKDVIPRTGYHSRIQYFFKQSSLFAQ